MYSTSEIIEIQNFICGKTRLSDEEKKTAELEFKKLENRQKFLYPFIGLSATNPELFTELRIDEKTKKYSAYGFFPETFDLVYNNATEPEILIKMNGNRGLVIMMMHPEKNLVIKPIQNSKEPETAQISGDLQVGPEQFKTLNHFLTENYIFGTFFPNLDENQRADENMQEIGRRTGDILTLLHSKDIFYNDTILTDDFGRSHLIVSEASPSVLIDYGVSINLDNHPNLSDEEVFNYARTLPINNLILEMNPSEQKINNIIQIYRKQIQNMTKEEIMARDIGMVYEGLGFAKYRLGSEIAEPFTAGFKETYQD